MAIPAAVTVTLLTLCPATQKIIAAFIKKPMFNS